MGKRLKYGKTCYHLNESLYHSFNIVLMDGVNFSDQNMYQQSWWNNGQQQIIETNQVANLFGMTCDGRDIIATNFEAPEM